MNYVIDTSTILYNWNSLRSFPNENIIIPYQVLNDLDRFKTDFGEVGDNARAACNFICKYVNSSEKFTFKKIFKLDNGSRLFLWEPVEGVDSDGKILNTVKSVQERYPKEEIILVTKKTSFRLLAHGQKIQSIDFNDVGEFEDKSGWQYVEFSADDFSRVNTTIGSLYYDEKFKDFVKNSYIVPTCEGKPYEGVVYRVLGDGHLKVIDRKPHSCGIVPKNLEQMMSFDLLMNDSVPLCALVAKAGTGKALENNSLVLTSNGFKKIKDLSLDDIIIGNDGKKHKILGIFPQGKKRVYEVHFTDGTVVECNDEHLWTYQTSNDRFKERFRTTTLREIIDNQKITIFNKNKSGKGKFTGYRRNIFLPIPKPFEFDEKELPIKPYTMGAMIGDGNISCKFSHFTSEDEDVIEKINNELSEINCMLHKISDYDYRIVRLDNQLSDKNMFDNIINYLGLRGKKSFEKEIPEIYLLNNIENRLELLKGLIDTDGSYEKNAYLFYTTSEKLAQQVKFLCESLGCVVKITNKISHYKYKNEKKQGRLSYILRIKYGIIEKLFFSKKREKQFIPTKCKARRTIEKIIETNEYKDMTCICVDSEDHLFLTNSCIPTHNTLMAIASALQKVLVEKEYRKLVITRPVVPIGRDIGFLPGDMEDKMEQWLLPFWNNIEYISSINNDAGKRKFSKEKLNMLLDKEARKELIQILPITYMRGSSISNAYIIIDEAQNTTPNEMKTIITRIGEGSKLVLTGDIEQIDDRFLSKECNGLTMAVQKFYGKDLFGFVKLEKSERSPLSELANSILF